MSSDQRMREVVERIETLVEEFADSSDPAIRRNARELVHLLMRLYGAGLTRILQIVELHEETAGRTVDALLGDDLIASLLVLHDLHPEDVATRIRRGLERLQRTVGATITLLELRDGAARVKVESEGETTSLLDLQRLIEGVIRALAPDVGLVDVEGLPSRAAAPLVQLRRKPPADRSNEIPTR